MRIFTRQLLASVTAVAAVTLVVAACSPDKPAPTPSPTVGDAASPSVSAPVSPNPGTGAPTAIDAYRLMWRAYVDAIGIPDPSYPDLAKYTQGDALEVFVAGLTQVKDQGLVGQGDVTINPSVTGAMPNANPPTVEVEDCVDTSQTRLVKVDGSPYQDTPGGKRAATAKVSQLPDGSWRVSAFALHDVGSC